MKIAIIVVACILLAGLIGFFTTLAVLKYRMQGSHNFNGSAFISDAKNWIIAHKPSKRRLIQIYAAVLFNANIKGYISGNIYTAETTKYTCVPGLNCYSCPGAVGSCPLGALQNALASSGTRAPYYVLGILAIFGIMLARTVCGFLCPVGLCQELIYKVRTPKLKKNRVTRIFSYLKYVILALTIALPIIYSAFDIPLPAFCKYICPAGTLEGAGLLLANPNNAGLFANLGWQFTWKFCLAIALIVASVFIFRFFCRFVCPLGAIYGFFNRYALIGVKVDDTSCINCGLCIQHCKMDTKRVGDHECINCGECISVCPTKAISWKGSQIFLHKNVELNEQGPVVKPLTVENGTVKIASSDGVYENSVYENNAVLADANAQMSVCTPVTGAEVAEFNETNIEQFKPDTAVKTAKRPKKSKKFWIELTVWILALALLATALICYNVDFDKDDEIIPPVGDVITGYNVGDTAPDFTVNLYGEQGGQFNLYSNRGKLTVLNFWATWCTPCVTELPYFIEFAGNHPEISVIAMHGSSTDDVQKFINRKGWNGSAVTFAQDNISGAKCLTFRMFGGTDSWPMTVVIDEEGKVLYNSTKSFENAGALEALISRLTAQDN